MSLFFRALWIPACFSCLLVAQTRSEAPQELNVLDPEAVYSFTGSDGEGFLRRSPVNLPLPFYQGQETGLVPLVFDIKPDGTVDRVRINPPLLPGINRAMVNGAINAVEEWVFAPLPATMAQEDQRVYVVIQYNDPESGVLYSSDGTCIIRNLNGLKPAHIYAPPADSLSGVVNAVVGVRPDGTVRGIYRYYGTPGAGEIPPRLGILTYETLKNWTFFPLPVQAEQLEHEITVTLQFKGQ